MTHVVEGQENNYMLLNRSACVWGDALDELETPEAKDKLLENMKECMFTSRFGLCDVEVASHCHLSVSE